MALHLTPEMLEAAYDFLRVCPPFRRWKLPPGDDVAFHVTAHKDRFGHCNYQAGEHTIAISASTVGRLDKLMQTMAHEIVHVYLDRLGVKASHGADFRRCAALVCRHHGFDEKLF